MKIIFLRFYPLSPLIQKLNNLTNVPPSFRDGGVRETHMGDVWEHPQILGKFRGDVIGVPVSKIIK
jgi:hypothetical protein